MEAAIENIGRALSIVGAAFAFGTLLLVVFLKICTDLGLSPARRHSDSVTDVLGHPD